jgi:hypothetical protein
MLNYVALGLLIFVFVFVFYAVIIVHDIPYEIAKKRKHPHQDAIHVAGWVSLLTLHIIWPFLWIWAMLYREDRGWGLSADGLVSDESAGASSPSPAGTPGPDTTLRLEQEIERLKTRLSDLQARVEGTPSP